MIEDNEKINIFRKECFRYLDFQSHIDNIDKKIELVQLRMENVHSPSMEKIGSSPSYRERPIIDLIEEKGSLEARKAHFEKRMKWIRDTIDEIPSPAYKALIWMTYVQRNSLDYVSRLFDVRISNLNKNRRKYLLMILDDAKMYQLDELQKEEEIFKNMMM